VEHPLQIGFGMSRAFMHHRAGHQIFFDGQVPEQRTPFDHLNDAMPHDVFRCQRIESAVVPCNAAARDLALFAVQQAADRLQCRRFAGAVRPQQ
jgi:hypothetical protein